MTGTSSEVTARDQSRPFVRNSTNWALYAPAATRVAKRTRPAGESGVVLGSEIIKNAKRMRAPLSRRWIGMATGSSSHIDRTKRSAAQVPRNTSVTSARLARVTTRPPADARRKAKVAALPHWPGDTHTCPVTSIITTRPTFVGLKTCLRRQRKANLLAIAAVAVATARSGSLVRQRRQSESPEMSALLGSKAASPHIRPHTYWVADGVPTMAIVRSR